MLCCKKEMGFLVEHSTVQKIKNIFVFPGNTAKRKETSIKNGKAGFKNDGNTAYRRESEREGLTWAVNASTKRALDFLSTKKKKENNPDQDGLD